MRIATLFSVLALSATVSACVDAPPRRYQRNYESPPSVALPPRMSELIVYPGRGQSPQQTDRDRYECHTWAVRQTGFDPSQAAPMSPPPPRMRDSDAPPPGAGIAAGAVAGAVLGAIVAPHGDEGGGAAVGAIAGAIFGGAAEQAQNEALRADDDRMRQQAGIYGVQHGERAGAYRRAISACLEARGYTVK